MSPGNVDLIRPIHEEWARGNWQAPVRLLPPAHGVGWSDEFQVRDGKVVRLEIFANRQKALESVGAVQPSEAALSD